MSNTTYLVGVGNIWVTPVKNYKGQVIPVNQRNRVKVGAIQDFSCSFTADLKSLKGSQSKFALSIAQTGIKITGKFKYANITGDSIAALFLGQAMDDGSHALVQDTVQHTINTSHSVTITPDNGGTFEQDLGVQFISDFTYLKRVASNPATGQYSVDESTGIYTFAAADENKKVYIDYKAFYATNGKNLVMGGTPMGPTPTFAVDVLITSAEGEQFVMTLPKCVTSKLDMSFKMDDHGMSDVEFEAFENELQQAVILSLPR